MDSLTPRLKYQAPDHLSMFSVADKILADFGLRLWSTLPLALVVKDTVHLYQADT